MLVFIILHAWDLATYVVLEPMFLDQCSVGILSMKINLYEKFYYYI